MKIVDYLIASCPKEGYIEMGGYWVRKSDRHIWYGELSTKTTLEIDKVNVKPHDLVDVVDFSTSITL